MSKSKSDQIHLRRGAALARLLAEAEALYPTKSTAALIRAGLQALIDQQRQKRGTHG